jgi:hypothetical protein
VCTEKLAVLTAVWNPDEKSVVTVFVEHANPLCGDVFVLMSTRSSLARARAATRLSSKCGLALKPYFDYTTKHSLQHHRYLSHSFIKSVVSL